MKSPSRVRLFATPWTAASQAPPSMGFSRQEYWSGLSFPSPRDLPDSGIEPGSPALQADALPSKPPGKPNLMGIRPICISLIITFISPFVLLFGGNHLIIYPLSTVLSSHRFAEIIYLFYFFLPAYSGLLILSMVYFNIWKFLYNWISQSFKAPLQQQQQKAHLLYILHYKILVPSCFCSVTSDSLRSHGL